MGKDRALQVKFLRLVIRDSSQKDESPLTLIPLTHETNKFAYS